MHIDFLIRARLFGAFYVNFELTSAGVGSTALGSWALGLRRLESLGVGNWGVGDLRNQFGQESTPCKS